MKELEYEYPVLEEAKFGFFICGDTPGKADDEDEGTDDL